MKIAKTMKKIVASALAPRNQLNVKNEIRYDRLIDKVGRYLACEMVEGSYCEFGVFRGDSFISSYKALNRHFKIRIEQEEGKSVSNNAKRQEIIDNMRFYAFDSFEGLPDVSGYDQGGDFEAGQYSFSEESFLERIEERNVDTSRVKTVKGWFEDTCVRERFEALNIEKVSLAWIDCDLYESTVPVLEVLNPFLSPGAILVFDDWFSHHGSPFKGEQRAFNEWLKKNPDFVANEYHKDSWKRNSFIINRRS